MNRNSFIVLPVLVIFLVKIKIIEAACCNVVLYYENKKIVRMMKYKGVYCLKKDKKYYQRKNKKTKKLNKAAHWETIKKTGMLQD